LEPKKQEIKFTPDYKAGKPIFLHVFEELANNNNANSRADAVKWTFTPKPL
jgi:hypothetical protein